MARTAAATIAGLAALTVTVHIARQRFTPSASAPSVQAAGTERSPSTVIAIIIGVIITVSTMIPTPMLSPVSWITYWTDALACSLIRCWSTNGTRTSTPIRP